MVCPSNNGGPSYPRRNSSSQNHEACDHSAHGHVPGEHEFSGVDDQRISEVLYTVRGVTDVNQETKIWLANSGSQASAG